MYYPGIDFQTSISIRTIYSIHYYEYRTDFTFFLEKHMIFWEFVLCRQRRDYYYK